MRRVLFMIMMAVGMTAMAQDIRLIEEGFSASGSMNMFWETENTDDISKADEGAKWHLEKKNGIITFWIDLPAQRIYNLNKTIWKDAAATIQIMESGMKVYIVRDVQFKHLMIMEYDKGKYLVHLCSIYEPL